MPARRSRPAARALHVVGAVAVTVGITLAVVGAGIPSISFGAADVPLPAESAPADPTPSAPPASEPPPPEPPVEPSLPAPTPPAPEPEPVEPPSDEPEVPVPVPVAPAPEAPVTGPPAPAPAPAPSPAPAPAPVAPNGPLPWVGSAPPAPVDYSPAVAASFGRVYPTNPWIYNDLPGTRYLDERESDREGRVTRRHMGIDAQGAFRQPVFAVAEGTVVGGTWGTTRRDRHGYGNNVEIAHPDGYATRYAHFAEAPSVQPGDPVTAGQLIGYMGGSQSGVLDALDRHLHFEVTFNGRNLDPIAFLSDAGTVAPPITAAAVPAVAAASGMPVFEIRPHQGGGYATQPTGLTVTSKVFTAVDMGGASAQIMVIDGGTLKLLAVVDGAWRSLDTQLPLNATSIAGADTGKGYPEALAVENGKLFHLAGSAAGWTKTWTGHYFSGTLSAVRMPGDQLHAMLQQSGYLYHLYPAAGGLWNVTDTGLEVSDRMDAVAVGDSSLEVMAVVDGQIMRITRGEVAWTAEPTGLAASGALAAVYATGGWPVAVTTEPGMIGLSQVVGETWTHYTYRLGVTGPIDAVAIDGVGTLLYTVG